MDQSRAFKGMSDNGNQSFTTIRDSQMSQRIQHTWVLNDRGSVNITELPFRFGSMSTYNGTFNSPIPEFQTFTRDSQLSLFEDGEDSPVPTFSKRRGQASSAIRSDNDTSRHHISDHNHTRTSVSNYDTTQQQIYDHDTTYQQESHYEDETETTIVHNQPPERPQSPYSSDSDGDSWAEWKSYPATSARTSVSLSPRKQRKYRPTDPESFYEQATDFSDNDPTLNNTSYLPAGGYAPDNTRLQLDDIDSTVFLTGPGAPDNTVTKFEEDQSLYSDMDHLSMGDVPFRPPSETWSQLSSSVGWSKANSVAGRPPTMFSHRSRSTIANQEDETTLLSVIDNYEHRSPPLALKARIQSWFPSRPSSLAFQRMQVDAIPEDEAITPEEEKKTPDLVFPPRNSHFVQVETNDPIPPPLRVKTDTESQYLSDLEEFSSVPSSSVYSAQPITHDDYIRAAGPGPDQEESAAKIREYQARSLRANANKVAKPNPLSAIDPAQIRSSFTWTPVQSPVGKKQFQIGRFWTEIFKPSEPGSSPLSAEVEPAIQAREAKQPRGFMRKKSFQRLRGHLKMGSKDKIEEIAHSVPAMPATLQNENPILEQATAVVFRKPTGPVPITEINTNVTSVEDPISAKTATGRPKTPSSRKIGVSLAKATILVPMNDMTRPLPNVPN